jgi:two-component system, LytTR family, sensor kinase
MSKLWFNELDIPDYCQMNFHFDIKRFRFYTWVGLVYFLLWMMEGKIEAPETLTIKFCNNAWRALYVICANYFFFDHILPMISRKKIIRSLLLLGLQFLIYSFGLYFWRGLGMVLHIWTPLITFDRFLEGVCYHFQYSLLSVFFFGIIVHLNNHQRLKQMTQQLRIEKQEAELNFLKSQTNPHFLFNTLNNIYALAKEKSDLAPESILKLSEILRFMLYQTSSPFLPIEQEIKIISDYIALEKLRYDDTLRVNFNYKIRDRQQLLPPLLLIPLVENAFKHGASETLEHPFVDISLSIEQQRLFFQVKNSAERDPEASVIKENIGLSNLRRQLELLYREYELSVKQEELVFIATLTINLSSHV